MPASRSFSRWSSLLFLSGQAVSVLGDGLAGLAIPCWSWT
jgi:hypothetical protein